MHECKILHPQMVISHYGALISFHRSCHAHTHTHTHNPFKPLDFIFKLEYCWLSNPNLTSLCIPNPNSTPNLIKFKKWILIQFQTITIHELNQLKQLNRIKGFRFSPCPIKQNLQNSGKKEDGEMAVANATAVASEWRVWCRRLTVASGGRWG